MQVRFLLKLKNTVRIPFKLTKGSVAFSKGATGLSHMPSCFQSILGVTVESVPGIQVYLECTGTLGSFEMVERPLEFLSSVKLSPPPLQVRQECWDSFPDEAGKWTLLSG